MCKNKLNNSCFCQQNRTGREAKGTKILSSFVARPKIGRALPHKIYGAASRQSSLRAFKNNNIILIGFMASGKTTIGKLLSEKLNLNFFDTDKHIEKDEGLLINEIFKKYGESYFRKKETLAIKMLNDAKNTVISTGGGIILNPENVTILKTIGTIIFLDTPFYKIKNRLKNSTNRPLNKDSHSVNQIYNERYKTYLQSADLVINAIGSPTDICNQIIAHLLF